MRTEVVFRYPAEFVPLSADDGILSASACEWFLRLLRRVADLRVEEKIIQEDWGAAIKVARGSHRLWIGLSMWPEGDSAWLAHVHHSGFALLQRFSGSGKREFKRLIDDLDRVLHLDPSATEIAWYSKNDLLGTNPNVRPHPENA